MLPHNPRPQKGAIHPHSASLNSLFVVRSVVRAFYHYHDSLTTAIFRECKLRQRDRGRRDTATVKL